MGGGIEIISGLFVSHNHQIPDADRILSFLGCSVLFLKLLSGNVNVDAGAGQGGSGRNPMRKALPGVLRNNFVCLWNGIWSSDWAR